MNVCRAGAMLILLGLMLSGISVGAGAQDCTPSFFNTEHRDSEWYYGVGKGSDAGEARKDALRQLYSKVSGGGTTVPAEALAGWEQDEYGECQGNQYVGVRIETARVKRNRAELKSRPQPSQNPPRSLPAVLSELEKLGGRQKQNQQQSQQQTQSVTIHTTDMTPVVVVVAILGMVLAFLAFIAHRAWEREQERKCEEERRRELERQREHKQGREGPLSVPPPGLPTDDDLAKKARAWIAADGSIICPSHNKPMGNSGERGQRWAAIVGHLKGDRPKGHGMKESEETKNFAGKFADKILDAAQGAP